MRQPVFKNGQKDISRNKFVMKQLLSGLQLSQEQKKRHI